MIIDYNDKGVQLRQALLKSNQVSQLKFWGFKNNDPDSLEFSGNDPEKLLLKTLAYLKKEKIIFNPTKSCESKVNSLLERTEEFQSIKRLGQEFKDGKYNKKQFKEFKVFFKSHLPTRKLKTHQLKAAFHLYLIQNGANFSVPGSGDRKSVV